ncbi:MAG: hypothetical protein ACRBBS_15955 [Thalassovita sp.]
MIPSTSPRSRCAVSFITKGKIKLVVGKRTKDWTPVQQAKKDGRFVRQASGFRNEITPDGAPDPTATGGLNVEPGRYRLSSLAPRALMARKLKSPDKVVPVTVVNPILTDEDWSFDAHPGVDIDPQFGATYLHQIYTRVCWARDRCGAVGHRSKRPGEQQERRYPADVQYCA